MDLDKLEERLGDVYDLKDIGDCRKVIQVLLRDLQRKCEEECHDKLKVLAKLVLANSPKAREVARTVEGGIRNRNPEEVVGFLKRMSDSASHVEGLSDAGLVDEVIKIWSGLLMDSMESAVLDEMIQRFRKASGMGLAKDSKNVVADKVPEVQKP